MKRYYVEQWDEDTESWEPVGEIQPCRDRLEAEREAAHYRSRIAYAEKVKTRVVARRTTPPHGGA